jgi:two-component system, OmpR family, response regulator
MRILVVEDESKLADLIRRGLLEQGLAADVASNGEDALWMAGSTEYDVILLDINLPGMDGFETCRRLREDEVWTPILMLTARDATDDRVTGLDRGADDYLIKPFEYEELFARIRALARRGITERPSVLEGSGLRLDPASRKVERDGTEIDLSAKEFALLHELMRNQGIALSRFHLIEHLWDSSYDHRSNVVDVYIRYLRAKVDVPFDTDSIETVRGVGYRLRADR